MMIDNSAVFAQAALESRAETMLRNDGFERLNKVRILKSPFEERVSLHVQWGNRFAWAEIVGGPTDISIADWFDRYVAPAVKAVEIRLEEEKP